MNYSLQVYGLGQRSDADDLVEAMRIARSMGDASISAHPCAHLSITEASRGLTQSSGTEILQCVAGRFLRPEEDNGGAPSDAVAYAERRITAACAAGFGARLPQTTRRVLVGPHKVETVELAAEVRS